MRASAAKIPHSGYLTPVPTCATMGYMKRTNNHQPIVVGTTYDTIYGTRATVVSLDHRLDEEAAAGRYPAYVTCDVPNPWSDKGTVSRIPVRCDNLVAR